MAENSKIEWTDHTWNPWIGCTKVGPGCDHCYAEARMDSRLHIVNWGAGQPRKRTSAANWREPIKWNARHEQFFAEHGRRQRVFCASLADVFDNEVPQEWRRDLFALIEKTPNLDWLLLTKRIGNAQRMIEGTCFPVHRAWPWPNVWLGATIVNQEEADRDIPKLLAMPAAVRFLSMEPLLGPVDIQQYLGERWRCTDCRGIFKRDQCSRRRGVIECPRCWPMNSIVGTLENASLDWVIAGGESGPNARPMHPDWARSLRDQCAEAGVPFLFKQWGEWTPGVNVGRMTGAVETATHWAGSWGFGHENLAITDGHIDDEPDLYRVGKKAAGRLLDGCTHDEFPRSQSCTN